MTKDEALRTALKQAYNLGQIYWQQADSEYMSQHRKADLTEAKFKELLETTVAALEAKDEIVAWLHKETGLLRKETISSKGADWDENHWKPLYTTPPQQEAKDEPVAWYRDEDGIRIYYESKVWDDAIPLYITSPQRKPLTEIALLGAYEEEQQGRWGDHVRGLRAIEAAHGIKGEA